MKYNILHGDCRELMATLDENSVDAIVTDPPYELGFMGKSWDASGVAFDVNTWKEALRVLKPGGHLIAFSGSRTYHRMAVAIEDAGFEIRDQIMWVYGSGFPKSHNISKGIDKAAGAEREVIGETRKGAQSESTGRYGAWGDGITPTAPATPAAQQWDGWGTALKPAHEPIVLARKPVIGTVANNVLIHGTGGLNIDGSRVGSEGGTFKASKPEGESNGIYGEGINGTVEIGQLNTGRWPANFIHDGSDEVVALFPDTNKSRSALMGKGGDDKGNSIYGKYADVQSVRGHDDNGGSAARFFYCAKASKRDRNEGLDGFEGKEIGAKGNGLARKCATCSASVIDGCACPDRTFVNPSRANHHPTVKPTALMQYLVRLVTPPNGTVLDPFLGSGSTGKACAYEGFDFIGMELTAEYIPIATARIEFALATKDEMLDL